MVVCGKGFIPLKMNEVWVSNWNGEVFQLTDTHANMFKWDSATLQCGMKYHLYVDNKDRGDGYVLCHSCALGAGFIW